MVLVSTIMYDTSVLKKVAEMDLDTLHGNTGFCTSTWDTVRFLVSLGSP